MENKADYPLLCHTVFGAVAALALLIGALGYLTGGSDTSEIPVVDLGSDALRLGAECAMLLKATSIGTLCVAAIAEEASHSPSPSWTSLLALRATAVVVCLGLATAASAVAARAAVVRSNPRTHSAHSSASH